MEKYKICPVCGAHNDPMYLECLECETDLQNVPVGDAGLPQVALQQPAPAPEMVRICDCGARNPVQARRCAVCGEDISMNIPVPDTAQAAVRYLLTSLDGAYAYEVSEGVTLIGRENDMREYLASKPYVSRKHAELALDCVAQKLTIRNCNAMNYTFVNNEMLCGDGIAELKDGDELALGGNEQNGSRQSEAAYFIVRIGTCM